MKNKLIQPFAWLWNKLFAVKTNRWILKNLSNNYCVWYLEGFDFKRLYK